MRRLKSILAVSPTSFAFAAMVLAVVLGFAMARQAGPDQLVPLDARNPIPYFIADGAGRTGYRSSDRELAQWALAAWQRNAGGKLQFVAGAESAALIRLYWAQENNGQYGEMRPITAGGRVGAELFIQPDTQSLGPEIAQRAQQDPLLRESIVYLTCLHELGHALGLGHTREFRDIMYSFLYGGDIAQYFGRYRAQLRSRSDIANVSGLSDDDVSHVRALYTGE